MITTALKKDLKKTEASTFTVVHVLSGTNNWGVENYVFNLTKTIAAHGVASHVVCTHEGQVSAKFASAGIPTFIVPIKGYWDWVAVNKLTRLFVDLNADVVHTHLGIDSFAGTIAAARAGIRTVTSVHFDHPAFMSKPFTRGFWKQVQIQKNKHIDHFLPVTTSVANELMKREKVESSKITVVPPGIDCLEKIDAERGKTRCELGVSAQDVVILTVGRLEPGKDFQTLISAVKLSGSDNTLKAFIVGDGAEKPRLMQQIADLDLADRVFLLGYRSDVPDLMSACDIFVLPSKAESFGISAVEAMRAGRPVIGTRGTGLSTIIDDGQTGLLFSPGDAKELSVAFLKLKTDASLRTAYGIAGKQRAKELFSSQALADSVFAVYRLILEAVR